MYQTPATVRHEGQRPQDYREGIVYVGKVLGLSPQLAKLLALYADCKDGFTPAAKFVEKKTGILAGNVARARKCLCRFKVIRYDANTREITVVWDKILEWAQRQWLCNQEQYPDFSRPDSYSFANYVNDFANYLPAISASETMKVFEPSQNKSSKQIEDLSETYSDTQEDEATELITQPNDIAEDTGYIFEDTNCNEEDDNSFDDVFAQESI